MHTHAVHRIARAARGRGVSTLRFQFRGVGLSQGRHDGGRGEQGDVRAALAWLADRQPGRPRLLCGFSFGAWMALLAGCPDPSLTGLLCAGLAVRSFDLAAPARGCPHPVAAVQAERDELGSPGEVEALFQGAAAPRRLAVVPGASHLFTEDLPGLEREAGLAFDWLLRGAA
jgi:alpha/beta superfamily hydrolase